MSGLWCRNGRYYADFVQNGLRRRVSLDTTDRKLAQRKLTKVLYLVGQDEDPFRKADAPIETFLSLYAEDMATRKSPRTVLGEAPRLDAFFRGYLHGRSKLSQIARSDIERFVELRLAGHRTDFRPPEETEPKKHGRRRAPAPAKHLTVNNDLRVIRHALNWAVERGLLAKSPFVGIKLFRTPKGQPRFIPAEDIPKLTDAAERLGLREYVALGLWAGLRKGEIAWLEWEDIDFQRRTLSVRNKVDRFGPSARVKSFESRTIPLHSKLASILEPLRQPSGFVVAPSVKPAEGKRYRYFPSTLWRRLAVDSGLGKALTVHALRHTFASHIAMAGVSLYKLSRWMGHADPRITSQYAHLAPTDTEIDRLAI